MLIYYENKATYLRYALLSIGAFLLAIFIPLNLVLPDFFSAYWQVVYVVITGLFAISIFFNFKKWGSSYSYSSIPFSNKKAAVLLIIDVLAAIPFLLFGTKILSLLQLIKLSRVNKFLQSIQRTEIRYNRLLTLVILSFWLIIAVHWLSCGWLYLKGTDTAISDTSNYVKSVYWAITTLTTVGYGDITPSTNIQMIYAMFVQLLGIGAFGFLIANVVSVISKKDAVELRYLDQVEQLTTTIKRRHLPKDVQKRILNYYGYMRQERMGYDETSFLETLPKSLKNEVALMLRKEFIEKITLFKNTSPNFISQLALGLELSVATPGDYLIHYGETGDEMFLILSGEIRILNEKNEEVAILKEGDYFGEIALYGSNIRNASAMATKFSNLYILNKSMFDRVISQYPDIAIQIEEKAKARGME